MGLAVDKWTTLFFVEACCPVLSYRRETSWCPVLTGGHLITYSQVSAGVRRCPVSSAL